MKMTRRDFLNVSTAAAVVCAATLLPVEKAAAAQQTLAAQNLLEQAYLYAFPLVIMDATRTASTNTRTATSNKAPINQFIHAEKLADATTRAVVTPNVDTIYTQAFLDVGAEPMIYGVPQTDRFFNVQVLDAWTNTAAVLEAPGLYAILPVQTGRGSCRKGCSALMCLPRWSGLLPASCFPDRRICPTSGLYRIRCS